MSTPSLSNYQLGDLLGRGASGSVYRALNFLTGETVAIKSISLLSLPPAALPDIMSEIDLLKNLNHPNIVKYKGFARDRENLFIVLEYCENGSLQTILKKFGKFPESLVAVYVSQVLEGLIYLHDQGVVHRDIKGANILTNKDGSVKLADFGVSSRTSTTAGPGSGTDGELGGGGGGGGGGGVAGGGGGGMGDNDNEVVGSPYWMAPEVIEQSGASTASDIWSVGCVVVELMEGRPPYGELAPMQALWRIVQDEQMRIPDGASPVVKDFLYHCFQKDPNLRVSAKKLLRHPWMLSARKALDTTNAAQSGKHAATSTTTAGGSSGTPGVRVTSAERRLADKGAGGGGGGGSGSGSGQATGMREKTAAGRVAAGVVEAAGVGEIGASGGTGAGSGTVRGKKQMTVYDEAVLKVQEWNEALNAAPKPLGTMRRLPIPEAHRKGKSPQSSVLHALPGRNSSDSLAAQPSSGSINELALPHGQGQGQGQGHVQATGLLQKNQHVSDVLQRAKEKNGDDDWDGDFDDVSFSKLGHRREESSTSCASEEPDQRTLKPSSHSPVQATSSRPRVEASKSRSIPHSASVEDYDDLGVGETAFGLESKLANLKLKNKTRKGILHPDDLKKLKKLTADSPSSPALPSSQQGVDANGHSSSMDSPVKPKPARNNSTPIVPSPSMGNLSLGNIRTGSARRHVSPSLTSLAPPSSPRPLPLSPPSSRQNSLRGKEMSEIQAQVDVELQKYQEDEDDWDGAFEKEGTLSTKATSSLQLTTTKRSNKSWRSAGEEDLDPFAGLDDDFDMSEDIEANLLRDKKATLYAAVGGLVERMQGEREELSGICDELLGLFEHGAEMGLEKHFVAVHGMLAVLEVLETRLARNAVVRLLKITNHIVGGDVDMLESFCLVGGIPVIIPYTSKKHALETRLEASAFISHLTRSPLTLQMFISCRGLRILVELLDEDYISNRSLILSALEGIGSVFDLQSPTPRNDFARMFVREGILDPLSTGLLCILRDEELQLSQRQVESGEGGKEKEKEREKEKEEDEENATRAISVLLLFCQVAQGDQRVRGAFASRTIIIRLLKACDLLSRRQLVIAVKAIKHLSTSPQLIEVLQNSNAVETLVGLLGKMMKGAHGNEICSHIFQTIFSMCRLSKARQEEAAASGIIPLLKRVITQKSPLKQFALPILCDLANAGKGSRRLLWHNDGLKLYLDLLLDPYWRVSALDAILGWMSDETARVEDVLVEKAPSDRIVQCFVQSSGVSFEGILDPLLKILRMSSAVTAAISSPALFRRLAESLDKSGKAVTKLNLLRITRVVCEHHPDRQTLVERFGLANAVEQLAKQGEAVLVRELAKEVIPILLFGNVNPTPKEEYADDGERDPARRRFGIGMVAPSGAPGGGTPGGSPQAQVRLISMKRTASEGMVETVREGANRERDRERGTEWIPASTPSTRPAGVPVGEDVNTGTQRSSASAETPRTRGYVPSGLGPLSVSPAPAQSAFDHTHSKHVPSVPREKSNGIRTSSGAEDISRGTITAHPRPSSRGSSNVGMRRSQTHAQLHSLPPPLQSPRPPSAGEYMRGEKTDRSSIGIRPGVRPLTYSSSITGSSKGTNTSTSISTDNRRSGPSASASASASVTGLAALASARGDDVPGGGSLVAGEGSGSGGGGGGGGVVERPKHKRMISRSQLREVQWQTDENGRLKSVRGPSKTT